VAAELVKLHAHTAFIQQYFEGRDGDFISLSIKDPEGFRKLALFLGKKPIQDRFPVFNETAKPVDKI